MRRGQIVSVLTVGALAAFVAGCSIIQTSKVDDSVTTTKLAASKTAVAVMRIGSASSKCINVAVLLGTREGEGYRRGQAVTVANVRSLAAAPVAEVELPAGEYHVIGYSCHTDKGEQMIMDRAGGTLFRTSFARFTLSPGEIVNIGYFQFGASHEGRSLFGRKVHTDVEITDWPLADIQRFQKLRPAVFAQMTTRLMRVDDGPPTAQAQAQTCETWRTLQAEGKVAKLPAECTGLTLPSTRR
jgi:hypothetical protein